jgi:hypothetical protein
MIMKQCKSSAIKIYYVSEKYPRLSDKKKYDKRLYPREYLYIVWVYYNIL